MGIAGKMRGAFQSMKISLAEYGLGSAPERPADSMIQAAPARPVAETSGVARPQPPDLGAYGPAGTPIVSGFITDLQEYNPQLRGRQAMPTYEKMRRSDADVAALLAAMKLPIRAADLRVVPGVEENEPEYALAKEIAGFVQDNLFGGLEYTNALGMRFTQRFESVIENALLAADFGCAGHEDLWTVDGDKVRLRRIAPRLPLTFYRFQVEDDGETLRAIQQWGYRGDKFVTVDVPADKFTLFAQHQEGANFYGISALRFAYQAWYMKQALYRITCIAAERNAMGIPKITAGLNPAREDMDLARSWVANITTNENTGIALPNGWDMVLQGITGRIYDPMAFIQHCSEQIVRSGLAMFMALGTTQSGSRALGNSMVDFFEMAEQSLINYICETISSTTIRRLVDYNYPRALGARSNQIPYPKLQAPELAVLNILDLLAVLKDVADSKADLLQPDDELENYLRKKTGLPLKAKETRVRYAPVVQRIEGTETSPEQEEYPGSEDGAKKPPGGKAIVKPNPNDPARPLTKDATPRPSRQGHQSARPRAEAATSAQMREANAPAFATPRGRALSRALKKFEEKHDWDGHAERADRTAAQIARMLRAAKPALIREAAARAAQTAMNEGLPKLDEMALPFPHAMVSRLERSLKVAHAFGRQAVYDERKKATGKTGATAKLAENASARQDKPRLIAEASVSDLNNWLTSRARGAAVDYYQKGLQNPQLEAAIAQDLLEGSDGYLDRIADESARAAVSGGRWAGLEELEGEIARYVRAEAMDANTCDPCAQGDGAEWESLDDVDWTPGDDCDGGDNCRGQLMPIFSDEGTVETG